jgi:hypothetical protein
LKAGISLGTDIQIASRDNDVLHRLDLTLQLTCKTMVEGR